MGQPFIETEPAVVANAGGNVEGEAGNWSEWGRTAQTAFGDAADAVCNAQLGAAVSAHSANWNPVAQRVAVRVSTLGSNVTTAAMTVDGADVDSAHLLAGQTQAGVDQGSLLNRPIQA